MKIIITTLMLVFASLAFAENQSKDISLVMNHPEISLLGEMPGRILSIIPVNQGYRDYVVNYWDGRKCSLLVKVILSCGKDGCISEVQSISEASCK